jgi:hypothetical protein
VIKNLEDDPTDIIMEVIMRVKQDNLAEVSNLEDGKKQDQEVEQELLKETSGSLFAFM